MNKFYKLLKTIYERPDLYWEFINTPTGNAKIDNANEEIRDMLPVFCFALSIFFIQYLYITSLHIEKLQGTAFIFAGCTYIFIVWVFAVVHTKNSRKRQILHSPKENSQQQHE